MANVLSAQGTANDGRSIFSDARSVTVAGGLAYVTDLNGGLRIVAVGLAEG